MELIKIFVRRPVTTLMMILVFVVLGSVSYNRMVVDLLPEIQFPLVQVVMEYPGAGPAEMESQIVKKIEDEVSNLSNIKKIRSTIYEGYAWTMIEFDLGVDVDIKALDVKDKVEQIRRELPDAAEDPVVTKFDPLSFPVVYLALLSERMSDRDLFELADKSLKYHFGQVPGVAKVELLGGRKRQINVLAQLDRLAQYGLTANDLLAAIGRESLDIPAGDIRLPYREIGVRFKGEARSAEDVANLTFAVPDRGVLRIADVARVEDGSSDPETVVSYNGSSAVLMEVYKRADGNTIRVADGIYERIEEVRGLLPEGVHLEIAFDTSTYIRDSVANAINNIFLGVFLCSLLLWVFLRDVRITLVAALVIPTSLVSAFLLMDFAGFTINIMTLMALGISIGTLVANAIVVLENIAKTVETGQSPADAAALGTKQVAVAVMASAGTNIVVFTPIAFMGGIVGQFFLAFGLTVVFATIFSLLASFSLTPMLSALFIREERDASKKFILFRLVHTPLVLFAGLVQAVQRGYDNALGPVLRHAGLTCLSTLILFGASLSLVNYIGGEFFPPSDENMILISAQLPKGATPETSGQVIREIERVLHRTIPDEMVSYIASAGGEGVGLDEVKLTVSLLHRRLRDRSNLDLMYLLQPALAEIPGAEIYTYASEDGPSRSDIEVDVFGPDYEVLADLASRMRRIAMDTGNFRTVFNKYREPKDELHFIPDPYDRAEYGTTNWTMGMLLRTAIEGERAGVLRIDGEEYEIWVRLDEQHRNSLDDMKNYMVSTPDGLSPLSMFGEFRKTKGDSVLHRIDKERVITLECFIANRTMTENMALLQGLFDEFKEAEFPPGYSYQFAGDAEEQQKTMASIRDAFILAIILTYMLLAAILNSFVHPITIMITVPLSVVGVILTLFFFGITINMMSMMAVVMLVGIVVNNAILIIDYALRRLETDPGDVAGCVREAGREKFRAILMTNLAILAAILPQVLGGSGMEFMIPLAAATMGGVAVSAAFTLFTIPALFVLMERAQRRIRGWATSAPYTATGGPA